VIGVTDGPVSVREVIGPSVAIRYALLVIVPLAVPPSCLVTEIAV
jgi:hypothetical protein